MIRLKGEEVAAMAAAKGLRLVYKPEAKRWQLFRGFSLLDGDTRLSRMRLVIMSYRTDDDLRALWRQAGGQFHGPNIETGTMPESALLPFLRKLGA